MPIAHINGWPLWTMTYRCGRSTGTATFFQPTETDARSYAARYADDAAVLTGRRFVVVSVSK